VYSAADLGVAVREFRTAAGLTQAELAHQAGVHRSYLSALENGNVSEQLERVVDLLRRLGVHISLNSSTTPR